MGKSGPKYNKVIELFDEKTNEVIRRFRFKKSTDFDKFIIDFKAMRFPGYNWRYMNKEKNE